MPETLSIRKRKPLAQTTNLDLELTTPMKVDAPGTVTRTSQRTAIKVSPS